MSTFTDQQQVNITTTADSIVKRLSPMQRVFQINDDDLRNGLIEELCDHEMRSTEFTVSPVGVFLAVVVAFGLGWMI
ncbi:MAG: hypothetical protein AAF950_17245 [Pseudomonadota bacterium]